MFTHLSLWPWGAVLSPPLCLGFWRCHAGARSGAPGAGRLLRSLGDLPCTPSPAACPALRPQGLVSPAVTRWDPGPGLNRGSRVFSALPWQYTLSGKKVEVAVKHAIAGKPVENCQAFSNPEALDWYRHVPELQGF